MLVVYFVLLALGTRLLARNERGWFVAYAAAWTAVLLFVCWLKGERPAWRWGGKD